MSEPSPAESAASSDATGGDAEVQPFFDHFARTLLTGDGAAIAAMWEAPALVVSDQAVHAVASREEVAAFFGGATSQYTERGIVNTRADLVWIDQATDRIVIAQVRWPYLDKDGKELGEETSTYTLRRADDGSFKIRGVVMHGAAGAH